MAIFNPKTKSHFQRILPYGMIWFFLSLVFFVVEIGVAGTIPKGSATRIALTPGVFLFAMFSATALGLFVGAFETFFLNPKLSKRSFLQKITYKLLFYTTLFIVITIITYPIAASMELEASVFDSQVWRKFKGYIVSWTNISSMIQLAIMLITSLFYAEIRDNIGHGVLRNFFSGKYHHPVEEKRVFMFLDMKASTTIAEALGHVQYFELLKSYYRDLSDAIVCHGGEIYQYVGDEIVITWPFQKALKNEQCLQIFFAMKKDLQKKAAWYQENYQITPSFKAGVHAGMVTTGEIGIYKQEIIFTGDVLNTTARIQSLCNIYDTEFIISETLLEALDPLEKFKVSALGETELKGRKNSLKLFSVNEL